MFARISQVALAAVIGVAAFAAGRPTWPCRYPLNYFEVNHERTTDTTAPTRPTIVGVEVERGHGDVLGIGGSCDDLATITIRIGQPWDAANPVEEVGYLVGMDGTLSPDFGPFEQDAWSAVDGAVVLYWSDGATDLQEPFMFELTLIAIDRAGNTSEPSEPWLVSDPGRTEEHLSAASAGCEMVRQAGLVARARGAIVAADALWLSCWRTAVDY